MNNVTTLTPFKFDYGQFNDESRRYVQERTRNIQRLGKQTAENIVEIGRQLVEVKERLPHGHYRRWLKAEFDWSTSSADNFVHCYSLSKSPTVGHSPEFMRILAASPGAAYAMAQPSIPDSVRQHMLNESANGVAITAARVREVAHQHKVDTARAAVEHGVHDVRDLPEDVISVYPAPPDPALVEAAVASAGEVIAATEPDPSDPVADLIKRYYRMGPQDRNEAAKQIIQAQLGETDLLPAQKQKLTEALESLTDYTPRD